MADPVVSVQPTRVMVEPGGQVPVTVTVRNTGQLVEGFRLTVHGAAADLAQVVTTGETEPGQGDVVRVYPGKEETATVVFAAPPVSAGLTGEVPFCVLAQSVVDPASSAGAEGDLAVGRVDGLTASLTPVTTTGRWSGRHTVEVSNWGNAPASLRLTASDPDEALGFLVHPDQLQLPVGASAVAAVRVRSRRPFLRGSAVRLPFRVVAEPAPAPGAPSVARPVAGASVPLPTVSDPTRPVLDGALNQKPVLSRATVPIAALGLLGLAAAVVVAVTAQSAPAAEQAVEPAVPVPQELTAEVVSDSAIVLGWAALNGPVDGIKVFRVKPGTEDQLLPVLQDEEVISGALREHRVEDLAPATTFCFQLAAVRGESRSLRSEPVCEATKEPPVVAETTGSSGSETPSGSPAESSPPGSAGSSSPGTTASLSDSGSGTASSSGSGSGSPTVTAPGGELPDFADRWVLGRVVAPGTPEDQILEREAELSTELAKSGRTDLGVGRVAADDYEDLGFRDGFGLVYVGLFGSQQEAEAFCPALEIDASGCHAFRPGKPKEDG